jgi:hypothetical protein
MGGVRGGAGAGEIIFLRVPNSLEECDGLSSAPFGVAKRQKDGCAQRTGAHARPKPPSWFYSLIYTLLFFSSSTFHFSFYPILLFQCSSPMHFFIYFSNILDQIMSNCSLLVFLLSVFQDRVSFLSIHFV